MAAVSKLPDNLSYLSPVGFRFAIQKLPAVNYFCQAANIPGLSTNAIPIELPVSRMYVEGLTPDFEDLTIRFVVDEYMKNWQEIYDWIIGLSPSSSLEQRAEYLRTEEKVSTGILTLLTGSMNPQMEFHFLDAFPTNLTALDFDSSQTDVEYLSATATFRYQRYEIKHLLNT